MRALLIVLVLAACTASKRPPPAPVPPSNQAPDDDDETQAETGPAAIDVLLALDVKPRVRGKGSIKARLELVNRVERPVQLISFVTGRDYHEPDGHFFQVFAADGSEIDYRGKMKKRADPEPGDFIELPPGGSVKGWWDITDNYPFPAVRAKYQVWFEQFNHFSRDDMLLKSNVVELEY